MRSIGVLWVLGALVPVVAVAWALADGAAPVPGPFAPSLVFLVSYAPLAYLGASLAMGPAPAPIAWVMLAVAASNGVVAFAGQYALHGLVLEPGSLPAARAAGVIAALGLVPNVLAGALLLPMVPTGRLPGGRARWLAFAGLTVGGVMGLAGLLAEETLAGLGDVANPLHVPGARTAGLAAVLWPVCVGAIAVWLMRQGDRLLARIGWLAILVSASSTLFGLLDRLDLVWISALIVLVLLIEVTLVTSRSERLWGLPTLMHRTVLWLVLASALALGYGAAVGVAAALGSELEGAARWSALLAAVAAAAAARAALGGWARRAIVGEGEDPSRAVARLLARLDAVRDAPQALVDAAAEAVRASHVTLDLLAGGHLVRAAVAGGGAAGDGRGVAGGGAAGDGRGVAGGRAARNPRAAAGDRPVVAGDRFALPLPGGVLAVTLPRGEHLPAAEQALLRDLCAHAAPALKAWGPVRLDVARLDAIAEELRGDPDPANLERLDKEVGALLDGVRALARELT